MPKMSTVSPNGMIAKAATAVMIEMIGASAKSKPTDVRGRNCSLPQQLDDVGERLDGAERADAVGAVAVLEAAEELALGDQDDGHELQADGEDDDALEDLDPPGLVVADLGERQAHRLAHLHERALERRGGVLGSRSRGRRSPAGTAARTATVAVHRARRRRRRARARRGATPRRCASAGDSSTRWRGCRNSAPARPAPPGTPRSSGRCPAAAGRWPRRPARARSSPNGPSAASAKASAAPSRSGQRTPRPPSSSSVRPA